MQRLKIYIVTDGPYSGTGFGEQMRQIGFLLAQTGLFEVYWQSLQHMGYPYDLPDSVFPDLPHKGSVIHMLPTYGNPTDFGSFIFPKHFSKYSPDIVIFMGDPKNIHSWIPMKQKVPFYMMFYTTLDGLPVPSYWNTEFFKNVDFLLAMSEWATNEFIKAGVKVKGYIHHGVNTDFWQQDLEEKYNMRRRFGIRDDTVLFVDRNTNQHRKRQDVLLKCWRDARPESKNMKLLLWMDWHCYSDDTEVLTSDGWKLFKDVTYEDKIATLNPTLNNLEYHKPITIIKKKYRGNMFHQKSRSIDLLVTPQHDLWVSRYAVVGSRTDGTRKNVFMPFSFVKAEDCPKKVAYKRDVGSWVGIEQDFFVLPSIKRNYPLGSTIVPELAIPMDDWLRFFGIWLAEGSTSYNSGYIIRVAQKQPDNCKIIKSWLDKIPIHSAKYGDSFVISNKQLWSYLRQFGKAKDKYIPKEYLGLSSRQLKILFDAMMLGDGNKTGNVYGTKSKRLADNIQEMLLKIGLAGTIGESFSIKNGKLLNIFRVSISSKNFCTPQANFPKDGRSYIDYDGMVYCVEVPNHIIYVRRNGKTVWCGNCRLGYDIEERIKQYNVPRNTIISPEDLTGFPKIWEAGDTIIEERGIARMADVNINATSGEGWGLINGEACSLGVPTISTKCSAVTEVVGKGGILVEPYCGYAGQYSIQDTARSVEGVTVNHEKLTEAILQLYGNKDERIELGCLGREHAMSYDFERQIIPAWSNILSSINPDEILLKMLNV